MHALLLLTFLFPCSVSSVSSSDPVFRDKWLKAVSKFEVYAHPLKLQFVQQLNQLLENDLIHLSPKCRHDLRDFSSGLSMGRQKETAMFDSFSKVMPGMISYQGYDLGSYDQCLRYARYVYLGIEFPVPKNESVLKFHQRAGENDWKIEYSKSMGVRRIDGFHFGICVPDSCREADLESVFNSNHVKQLIKPLTVTIHTTDSKSDAVTRTWRQVIATIALLIILGTGILSAIMNHFSPESAMALSLQAFDVVSNTRHLMSPPKQDSMFTNINYYRVVYVTGSIMVHVCYGLFFHSQFARYEVAMGYLKSQGWVFQQLVSHFLSLVPPLLTTNIVLASCFTTMKYLYVMRRQKVRFSMYLMERALRLLPVIGTVLLFTQTLPLFHLSGPTMSHMQTRFSDICYKNAWKELLFINNFDRQNQLCFMVAWFTSADFQIYFMTFPVLLLASKYPQHALKFFAGVVVTGILASGSYFVYKPVSPIIPSSIETLYEVTTRFGPSFYNTVHHIPVYGIGMMLGYVILNQEGKQKPVSLVTFIVYGTSMLIGIAITSTFYMSGEFIFGSTAEIFYAAIIRSVFAAAFSLLFYALLNCDNKLFMSVAASRIACTMSRLTFTWFFTHPIHIMFMMASQERIHLSLFIIIMEFLFVFVTSFFSACVLHVFVEAPVSRLISMSMKRKSLKSEKEFTKDD